MGVGFLRDYVSASLTSLNVVLSFFVVEAVQLVFRFVSEEVDSYVALY